MEKPTICPVCVSNIQQIPENVKSLTGIRALF